MNIREIREHVGIRPWRLLAMLVGFAIALFVTLPLARYSGMLDFLGYTCDAQEKAALMEFPSTETGSSGRKSRALLEARYELPPLQEPPAGVRIGVSQTGRRLRSRSRLTTRSGSPSMDGRSNGFSYPPILRVKSRETLYTPHVDGARDDLRYEVHYWPTSLSGGSKMSDFSADALDREGTGVNVVVYKP
jgi:hypothetical protein